MILKTIFAFKTTIGFRAMKGYDTPLLPCFFPDPSPG